MLVTGSCYSPFFLLACPFVSRVISFIYDVRVRGVVSMFDETSHSLFVCGSSWALPCCCHTLPCRVVVTAKWVVSCTRITCIQPLSRCSLTLLASSFVSESVVVFSLYSPSFSPCVLSFFFLVYWPFRTRLLACLIRAAILYFSCLHLFTSRCFLIGSPD